MRLMQYSLITWDDVVAIRVEGATSNCVNAVLQDVDANHKPGFCTWSQFKEAMVQELELVIEVEEAQE